jgi:hypothetical protein
MPFPSQQAPNSSTTFLHEFLVHGIGFHTNEKLKELAKL